MQLSIIIPAYNCENTIIDAIKSTGAYFNNNIEVIVINNGSTDNTKNIVRQEALKHENIIYTESEKGVSNARNKGIDLATSRWITFLDSDDQFKRPIDSILDGSLEKMNEDLIIFNYFAGNSKIDLYSMIENKKEQNFIVKKMIENPTKFLTVWGKLYKTDLLKINNIKFSRNLSYSEDSEFLIRYLLKCKKIKFSKDYLYNYNMFETSTVRTYNPSMIKEYEYAIFQIKSDLKNITFLKDSFNIFVLMQFNLMMIHNVFINKDKNKIAKMKELCQKGYMKEALAIVKLVDLKTARMVPLVFCKYHMYRCASFFYRIRVIQNQRKAVSINS